MSENIEYSEEALLAMGMLSRGKPRPCTRCKRPVAPKVDGGWRITCPHCGKHDKKPKCVSRTTIMPTRRSDYKTRSHPLESRLPNDFRPDDYDADACDA